MDEQEDLGDPRSRNINRKYIEKSKRTFEFNGRYIKIHPFKADAPELVKAILGVLILSVILVLLILEHFKII